jgi:tetratricopeptide (TPR) repeat protein
MRETLRNKFQPIISIEAFGEAEALRLLILDTNSSLIAFALHDTVMEREVLVNFLRESLSIPIVEFTLSARQKNPLSFLQTLSHEKRACVFFYNLEEALPELVGYVNLQRETFAEFPHAVVFWVSEYGLREIANKAPDFWTWRSGVFDFRTGANMPGGIVDALAALPFEFRDRGDLERRIDLYQKLFKEYSQHEKQDARFLSDLQKNLSISYYYLGMYAEGEAQAQEALDRIQKIGDRKLEAELLIILGNLESRQWQIDEAQDHLMRAEEIFRQLGNDDGLRIVYHQLGNIAEQRHQIDQAEAWYRKAIEIGTRLSIDGAPTYHQLGNIALERHQLDQAEDWYRKALEITERQGPEHDLAHSYHQLGNLAERRHQLEQAEAWYRKALEIKERLGLEHDAANTYHQLGVVAQGQHQLDQAEAWYHKALEIRERLGIKHDVAAIYHQLGTIAQYRNRLDEAEAWYRKSLEIMRQLGLERNTAPDYYHLGTITQKRGLFEKAEQYYLKALEIAENSWHSRFTVFPLENLGNLYLQQNQFEKAIEFFSKALPLATEFDMQPETILAQLALLMKTLGEDRFVKVWEEVAAGQKPPIKNLHEIVKAMDKDKKKTKKRKK